MYQVIILYVLFFFQARNFMRDQMKKGQLAFFYHSNCKNPGIAGIAEVKLNVQNIQKTIYSMPYVTRVGNKLCCYI